MCVAFTGFIGSLRENQCLLKFYYISLAILFVCETIIGVFFFIYRESAMSRIEEVIKKTFISQYREVGFEDSTKFVDFIQVELQCCGAKSYNDWTENRYFSCNSTNYSSKACGVPYSCCKRMNNINLLAILLAKGLYTQIGDQLRLLHHEGLLR
ncbi:unnamed protein product [Rodentolepis nana]|uniref:Tetraspanin n=1 Tax=Rodentolepis nana TaxID=102285 RepID=A0A0R3T2T4_RODNA|nr:unnamed protein product [Rodentolepis nana]